MPFKDITSLEEFASQPWSKTTVAILDLRNLGLKLGLDTTEFSNTIWWFAVQLADLVDLSTKPEFEFDFSPLEKSALSLCDADLITSFIASLGKVEEILSGLKPVNSSSLDNSTMVGQVFFDKERLILVGLKETVIKKWSESFKILDVSQKQRLNQELEKFWALEEELHYQIAHVASIFNHLIYPRPVLYTNDELQALFQGEKTNHNQLRLLYTLAQASRTDERQDVALKALMWLNIPEIGYREIYDWDDILFLLVILHLVFGQFTKFDKENQLFLLEHYFYRAQALGVPVRKLITETLYETTNIVDYILLSNDFFTSIKMNDERIVIHVEPAVESKMLGLLLGRYLGQAGDKFLDGLRLTEYLSEMLPREQGKTARRVWLQEVFDLALHLKNVDLLESNRGSEMLPHDLFTNDMISLTAHFGIGEAGAGFIVNYFEKPNHLVPLNFFLRKIKELSNLEEQVAIDNILELSQALKINNLISTEDDLLVFDEQTGNFVWNENVLK